MSIDFTGAKPAQILLVEDNQNDAELTREGFRQCEIDVILHHVKNGVECMNFLRKQGQYEGVPSPDLVLLDLKMPVMDGRQVLAEIVADEHLKHLPVVILTTADDREEIVEMYKLGANSYFKKPIDLDEFLRIIQGIGDYWFTMARLPRTEQQQTVANPDSK